MKKSAYVALLVGVSLLLTACGATLPPPSWPGIAVSDEVVFLSSGAKIYALDVTSGAEIWSWPPAKNNNNLAPVFYGQPAIVSDTVLASAEITMNSHRGAIYAFDAASGAQRWCVIFINEPDLIEATGCQPVGHAPRGGIVLPLVGKVFSPSDDSRIFGGITVTNAVAYVGLASGKVYALDVKGGEEQWAQPFTLAQGGIWASPVVADDMLYVTSLDHHLYALERTTGTLRWKTDLGAAAGGAPTIAEGKLYVTTFATELHALDAREGKKLWTFTPPERRWFWDGPAVAQGTLYVTDLGGHVYALNADSGELLWEFVAPAADDNTLRSAPVVSEDTVYVGGRNGTLFALNTEDGSRRWSQSIRAGGRNTGQLLSSPVIISDTVLVAPYQSHILLHAYNTAGAELWSFPANNQ